MSSVRKHFSLEAANFSLFSQEGEVTSSLIPGPAWSLRLQFTKYQQRYAPMKMFYFYFIFFCNSTYSLYPENWIIQEPVFVLHLFTCHGHIMPCLAELLFYNCLLHQKAITTPMRKSLDKQYHDTCICQLKLHSYLYVSMKKYIGNIVCLSNNISR